MSQQEDGGAHHFSLKVEVWEKWNLDYVDPCCATAEKVHAVANKFANEKCLLLSFW